LGAVTIAEYLESDPPIDRIDLNHNRLSDDDVILISQALKSNTSLKTINLLSNNITSVGIKALLTCVFDSSSLHSISESNHTLDQMILFSYQKNGSLADSIDRLIELDRARKILLALNDKDSLLQYLANVPVELIPEMLTFPHGRQPVYLNIVYSTMRWWNMPMLYSYNCCV
jgi:Ran GTPase-activating protein (RanGAP) involved in mRNA processing and transport